MGGGGGGPSSIGDVRSLIEHAKEELREGAKRGVKNVFISFAHEDIDEVNLLRGQAKNDNSLIEFNDWAISEPIESDRAEYIKRKIRDRIAQSSVTVVYVSDHTADSKWVDWEVQESIDQGKGVVAMYQGSGPPSRLPPALKKHKIKPVPWSQEILMKAIEKAAGT
jgi:hypothetical protein